MKLVNLTPHPLRVIAESDKVLLDLPACARPPRIGQEVVGTDTIECGDIDLPVQILRYQGDAQLPPFTPDVLLIVPRVLAREMPRPDLLFPDGEVRDGGGRIVGCRRLARFATCEATR